ETDVIEHAPARWRLCGVDGRDVDVDAGQIDGVIVPPCAPHAAEVRRVPLLGRSDLILRHVQMDVVGDDRHRDLAVVPLGDDIAAAAVDRESEIRGELVVEQLDALAFGRVHGTNAGNLRDVLDLETGTLDRG